MRCAGCGTENPEGMKFCEECGAQLGWACPSWGQQVRPTAKFCGECRITLTPPPHSTVLNAASAATVSDTQWTSVHSQTPPARSKRASGGPFWTQSHTGSRSAVVAVPVVSNWAAGRNRKLRISPSCLAWRQKQVLTGCGGYPGSVLHFALTLLPVAVEARDAPVAVPEVSGQISAWAMRAVAPAANWSVCD
jgi:double zinc ribbon protein